MKDALDLYYSGMNYQENGNLDEALLCFNQSLVIDEHFKTYHRIFQILKIQGKLDECLSAIESAYKLNNRNDKVASDYAEILIQLCRYEEAVVILSDTLKRNPSFKYAKKLIESIEVHNKQINLP